MGRNAGLEVVGPSAGVNRWRECVWRVARRVAAKSNVEEYT